MKHEKLFNVIVVFGIACLLVVIANSIVGAL